MPFHGSSVTATVVPGFGLIKSVIRREKVGERAMFLDGEGVVLAGTRNRCDEFSGGCCLLTCSARYVC